MDKCDEFAKIGNKITYMYISGHCSNIVFTDKDDKFNRVDVLITGNTGTKAVMEIKCRRVSASTVYDDGGHIFEWKKYAALKDEKYTDYKPIYEMIYPDCIMMWDVTNITEDRFVFEKDRYKATTMGTDHSTRPKKVAYLKKDECCTIITRTDNEKYY